MPNDMVFAIFAYMSFAIKFPTGNFNLYLKHIFSLTNYLVFFRLSAIMLPFQIPKKNRCSCPRLPGYFNIVVELDAEGSRRWL